MSGVVAGAAPVPARGPRTALPAAAAVVVALGGHLAGGGAMVSPLAVVGLAAGAAALSYRLSAHRWSPRTLTALVVLAQAVVHLVCGISAHGAMDAPTAGPAMLLGHAVATAVTVAALAHGESLLLAVRHLIGLLGRAAASTDVVAAGVPVAVGAATAGEGASVRTLRHAHWGGLRGPPCGAVVRLP